MRALVKYDFEPGAVALLEVPDPVIGANEVLIETRVVGVCGSDVHAWMDQQSWEMDLPVVLGHESAGVIVEVGTEVKGWSVGDRVVVETAAEICGDCAYCRSGRYNVCPKRQGYGAKRDGAFGALLVAEPRVLHRIPDNVSFEAAAMTEPYAVACNALVERAEVRPGDHVVVQGAGAIGAICAQIAKLQGAATVVVIGTGNDRQRLKRVLQHGADRTVVLGDENPVTVTAQLGDGLGADVVVDATGVSAALQQSLELVRPLGSIVKVGWGPQPFDQSLDMLVAKSASLLGCFSHTWTTWERVLTLFSQGSLNPSSVLGGNYALEDWREGFERMHNGTNIKSVISFD